MKTSLACLGMALCALGASSQPYDIFGFDETLTGPWSHLGRTTRGVPKVPNGSVVIDGAISQAEYGGFRGVVVQPGDPTTEPTAAWILSFPGDRAWDGPDDSGFTFWLAHDDTNLYVGVETRDDVLNSDDPNSAFWKDDAIEIVVDALNDRFDNNTDNSNDPYGGHNYVNYLGRFSRWDDVTQQKDPNGWSTAVDWTYGEAGDIHGLGKPATGGWHLEVRFSKRQFEDPAAGNRLRSGYAMGFNIGLDDDDKQGLGANGNGSRTEDLEIQYFWANRERLVGWNADEAAGWLPEDIAYGNHEANYSPRMIDANGRLSHGGTGEIIFGFAPPAGARRKVLFLTSNAAAPPNADPSLIALIEASYDVTVLTPAATTQSEIDALVAAADAADVVFISETIGSASVVNALDGNPGRQFALKNVDVPIISCEAYMFDDAFWTTRTDDNVNDFINWGNTSRSEVPEEIQGTYDSVQIRKADHPIAGGLTGAVKVYDWPYSLNWGVPSADADIVMSVLPDGRYPTLFVYDTGDKLTDGSTVPNKRIGLFVGQAANPNANYPLRYNFLSETGRTLVMNTLAYAVGGGGGGATPTLSVARNGNQIVITYAGGQLQSATSVPGTWSAEAGASPLTLPASSGVKFFRVVGN